MLSYGELYELVRKSLSLKRVLHVLGVEMEALTLARDLIENSEADAVELRNVLLAANVKYSEIDLNHEQILVSIAQVEEMTRRVSVEIEGLCEKITQTLADFVNEKNSALEDNDNIESKINSAEVKISMLEDSIENVDKVISELETIKKSAEELLKTVGENSSELREKLENWDEQLTEIQTEFDKITEKSSLINGIYNDSVKAKEDLDALISGEIYELKTNLIELIEEITTEIESIHEKLLDVDEKTIKAAGVRGVVRSGRTTVQIIIGPQVQHVAEEMKKIL